MEAVLTYVIPAAISGVSAVFAALAAKNSKPVGNGFTKHVMEELRGIRERIDNHIDTHHNRP